MQSRRDRIEFFFLNVGHFLDHFLTLIFATVAALTLAREWGLGYDALILYATPGIVAFGAFALPAGWLADRWSREGMMAVFFVGIGVTTALTALARSPMELAACLFITGIFAAIYHPVGIAMVADKGGRTGMRLAVNGVWGNIGVACAALVTGFLIENAGWRHAFVVPGVLTVALGFGYVTFLRLSPGETRAERKARAEDVSHGFSRSALLYVSGIIFFTTLLGSLIFHSMTFALPKVIAERVAAITTSPAEIGRFAFYVITAAAFAQIAVGYLLDRFSVRVIYGGLTLIEAGLFWLFIGSENYTALAIALALMLMVFGQVPINDYLIGKLASSEVKARAYAARFLVGFTVASISVPLVAWMHGRWGFDGLFVLLGISAISMTVAIATLPNFAPAKTQPSVKIQPAE
ncbi:MAG: MFS transporter [Hyphomicrobiaceae bacterium]|nr:MAG: MFS transporter [Hyphomicrobiaceae bacterium]